VLPETVSTVSNTAQISNNPSENGTLEIGPSLPSPAEPSPPVSSDVSCPSVSTSAAAATTSGEASVTVAEFFPSLELSSCAASSGSGSDSRNAAAMVLDEGETAKEKMDCVPAESSSKQVGS
jgi:hypothetical protein